MYFGWIIIYRNWLINYLKEINFFKLRLGVDFNLVIDILNFWESYINIKNGINFVVF